jgi:hypothetical protein
MLLHVCLIAKDLAEAWPKRGVVSENVEMKPQQRATGNWCRASAYFDTSQFELQASILTSVRITCSTLFGDVLALGLVKWLP